MKAYSLPAVTKTMRVGHKKSKAKGVWTPTNKHQQKLIDFYNNGDVKLIETELGNQLKTKAEVSGAMIKLTTLLNVGVEWVKKGKSENVKSYKGVLLDSCFSIHENGVAVIRTKSNDLVVLKKGKLAGTDLMDFVKNANTLVAESIASKTEKYDELLFPKVDFDEEVDMSKVLGMEVTPYSVVEASQQVKFAMDEAGAKVKVEVRMTMLKSARPRVPVTLKRFVIDGPFTVMMVKAGSSIPYFAANVTTKQMQKA